MEFQDLRKSSEVGNPQEEKEEDEGKEETEREGEGEGEEEVRKEDVLEDVVVDLEEGECMVEGKEGRERSQRGHTVKKTSLHQRRKDVGKPSGSRGLTKSELLKFTL